MQKFLLIFFLFFFSKLFSQTENVSLFIPKNYDTLSGGFAKGDLNKDGVSDIVLALNHKMEKEEIENIDDDSIPSRLLIILLGSKNGYIESTESKTALLCKDCGGVFGDPFAGVSIEKNILIIYHYGGSNWRWSITDRFRFQNNNWYLIGETKSSYWDVKTCDKLNDFAGTEYDDENFVTGQFEIKKISEDCKLLENKKGKKTVQPLISLNNFNIDN